VIYQADHSQSVYIRLDPRDVARAEAVARELYEKSHADGRSDAHGFTDDGEHGFLIQHLGACTELAVAKALCIYWPGWVDQGDRPDLPFNIEVRSIGYDHYGLRVRSKDPADRRIVGAVPPPHDQHFVGRWRIPGWIVAENAKRSDWQMAPNNRPPFYAVPQHELWPLFQLRLLIAKQMQERAYTEEADTIPFGEPFAPSPLSRLR